MNLEQKVIFITGASSGIGLSTSIYFAEKGWGVIAAMRNLDKATLLSNYQNIKVVKLDVTDSSMIFSVVEEVMSTYSKVDVVLNNAGYGAIGPFEFASENEIQKQIDTNFVGLAKITSAFIPYFKKQNSGVFVNISSIAGRMALPYYSLYHASKYAVEGFSESLSYELAQFNIKVKIIEPGPIKTEFNDKSRVDLIKSESNDYEKSFNKVNSFYTSLFNSAIEPKQAAKVIYRAATSKINKLRYGVGVQAKLLLVFNKLLPAKWFRYLGKVVINF